MLDWMAFPAPVNGQSSMFPQRDVQDGYAYKIHNFVRRGQRIVRRPGLTPFATVGLGEEPFGDAPLPVPAEVILGLVQYNADSEDFRIVCATDEAWYRFNKSATPPAWVDVTGAARYSVGATNLTVFKVFVDVSEVTWLLGVNGSGKLMSWDGTTFSRVTDAPDGGHALEVLFDRVLVGQGRKLWFSDNLDFTSFADAANPLIIGESAGDIVAIAARSNLIANLYKETGVYQLSAQPELLIPFRSEPLDIAVPGPVSRLSVVTIPGGIQVYLARDGGLYLVDPSGVRLWSEEAQYHIQRTINWNNASRCFGVYDTMNREVHFYYPTVDSVKNNHGVVVSFPDGAVFPRDTTGASANYPQNRKHFTAGCHALMEYQPRFSDFDGTFDELDPTLTFAELDSRRSVVILGVDTEGAFEMQGIDDDGYPITASLETGLKSTPGNRVGVAVEARAVVETTAETDYAYVQIVSSHTGSDSELSLPKDLPTTGAARRRTLHRADGRWFGAKFSLQARRGGEFGGIAVGVKARSER